MFILSTNRTFSHRRARLRLRRLECEIPTIVESMMLLCHPNSRTIEMRHRGFGQVRNYVADTIIGHKLLGKSLVQYEPLFAGAYMPVIQSMI